MKTKPPKHSPMENGMERSDFLKLTGAAALSLALPWELSADSQSDRDTLLILHTNDVHSRIDPFPSDHPRYAGQGGAEARARAIAAYREKYKWVLLFDAGDIFQGTPYFNMYKGEPEIKLMSAMAYDAATLGNHDFDLGLEGFSAQWPHANFDLICSNYEFKNGPMDGIPIDSKIYRRGPFQVGVFGLGIELKGLVPGRLYGETTYRDPIESARNQVAQLRKRGCDLVVCLSHLGYEYRSDKVSDRVLARECPGIDLIIGGHTHSFLEEGELQRHPSAPPCRIVQAGWGGLRLGVVRFSKKSPEKTVSALVRT